jgi:hypothetical protein
LKRSPIHLLAAEAELFGQMKILMSKNVSRFITAGEVLLD